MNESSAQQKSTLAPAEFAKNLDKLRKYKVDLRRGIDEAALKDIAMPLCATTSTERFENPACRCPTYPGNLGPCASHEVGSNGRCVYCDHEMTCHPAIPAVEHPGYPRSPDAPYRYELRTYSKEALIEVDVVHLSKPDITNPYSEDVPFSVGSNQRLVYIDEDEPTERTPISVKKHTPPPYSLSGIAGDCAIMAPAPSNQAGKIPIAFVVSPMSGDNAITKEEGDANKEFIVRACNCHEDLVTACYLALCSLQALIGADNATVKAVLAAIKKAEAKI